jgi:hypothetical protein
MPFENDAFDFFPSDVIPKALPNEVVYSRMENLVLRVGSDIDGSAVKFLSKITIFNHSRNFKQITSPLG